ncbi:MAG: type II toxin-antitoxin system VapC family toxin [Actinomycetota bacterium]|nr:type II toxin-antitoxin system VapC family toxin [Actinomycetota bacterium]
MPERFDAVLDASALLALLQGERGAELIEPLLDRSAISAVNWSEVVQRLLRRGLALAELGPDLDALDLSVVSFDARLAEAAAELAAATRPAGLSLADRACLALARETGAPAFTADRLWESVDVGVEIRIVR